MGPGTHIVERLIRGIKPTDPVDAIAMWHDLDYLTDEEPIFSDLRAILRTYSVPFEYSGKALAMRLGLTFRSFLDLAEHALGISSVTHLNTDFRSRYTDVYNQLQKIALGLDV